MPNLPHDPISVAEAARLLGVDVSTVNRRIRSGQLDGVKVTAGIRSPYVVSRSEVLDLLAASRSRTQLPA